MRLQTAAEERMLLSLAASAQMKKALLEDSVYQALLLRVADVMSYSIRHGGKILFFGNGGSAADAQHLAAEFLGRYLIDRRPLPAIALTTNTSALTAIANDYDARFVFSRQLEALGVPGDVAVGISTSGQSANVLEALNTARSRRLVAVGLTGSNGLAMRAIVDYCLAMPSTDVPRIQEGHILTGHILCELVEHELFSE